jgi:ABC-type glycerol-3-phosphate transport system substrate-binding protein
MLTKLLRWISRPAVCRMVDDRLEAYLDGALSPAQSWAITAHLEECARCQALVGAESARLEQFRGLGGRPRVLSRHASVQIRHNVRRRMYWRYIMQQTQRSVQGFVVLGLLVVLAAGSYIWWQQQEKWTAVDDSRPPAVIGSATLTLAIPDGAAEHYRALAAAFMEEHEGITVQVESLSRLTGNSSNPARALAQSADLFPSGYAFAGDWQSLTLDLTPFAAGAAFDAGDFPAGLLYAPDGTIRHLPQEYTIYVVAYNKALFDNAGLSYPTPEWTWEEFLLLAMQLTQRYGDFTAQYGWADGLAGHVLVGAGLARPLLDYTASPPAPRLTEEAVVAAVNRYLDLYGENGVAPMPRSAVSAYSEAQNLIREQRVAMWLAPHSSLADHGQLDVGILPLPLVDGQDERRLYVFSRGFAVSAATQQPQAAWQFLEYLSRQPGLDENAAPARASVRQARNFWQGAEPQVAELVEKELVNAFELIEAPVRLALTQAVATVLLEEGALPETLAREQVALQQRFSGEATPLEFVTAPAIPAAGRILFIAEKNVEHFRLLARAFEEENPGLVVEVEPPSWTFFFGTGFRSLDRTRGGQADCFTYGPLQTEAEAARVLQLDALLELDTNISRDDFYTVALNAFMHDGALVALPYYFGSPLIGYDTSLFDAVGVPYPEVGWTIGDFLETAVALTSGEGSQKRYGFVPSISDYYDGWLFLHAFGVDLLDHSVEPPSVKLNTEQVAEVLRWYVALSQTYGVKPVYHTNLYDFAAARTIMGHHAERDSLFAARRGAMWWDDGTEVWGPRQTVTGGIEERQYTTFPIVPQAEAMVPMQVTGLYISAHTEQRQACWQWLAFLLEHDPGVSVPARRSVAQSEAFGLRAGPAAAVMLHNVELMSERQLTYPPEWMDLAGWYSIALTRALEAEMTVEEVLAVTQSEFELYRDCVIERELFAPANMRQRLVECAVPASPYVILGEE